jgi:hypothetical protein
LSHELSLTSRLLAEIRDRSTHKVNRFAAAASVSGG